ncbi:poly(3-hydroxybutyrate) depolymerase [Methylocapsa palsarum]|uniref:Poly(3-hydroxybutyrate) depolymerase n=1 Tax=Methylocapsa palsarum TaxID=1612308 RepID=A0A1I4CT59_9HYPH|nr:poly(3-hydroxybutyrate) depolymerase [Methylocapsa palsarum]SFK83216.1 Poly(3-hydroxybutyrate) depolymerase [Methylocapsa palsarum]
MRMRLSWRELSLIAALAAFSFGVWVWSAPPRPEVGAAGRDVGLAAACDSGGRTGRAGLDDNVATSDGLRITVRTPSNYDSTRAYPLLVVYPPAGYDRQKSEIFYGLTPDATRRGFIVSYSDHLRLSRQAVAQQAKVAATVASLFCVDPTSVAYLGHSDGATIAEGITASLLGSGAAPRAIVASAAGITREDLAMLPCPSVPAVLIVHSRADALFPDFGRSAAAYWAQCASCAPADLEGVAEGCRDFSACAEGRRVAYCATAGPHSRWPAMNAAMLDFIQGVAAKSP